MSSGPVPGPDRAEGTPAHKESLGLTGKARRVLFGAPRDLADRSIFHRISLIPVLAWIGLGADGLSSSSYGPDEAFRTLGEHTYLALALAAATTITIAVISASYSRIIEEYPQGGGGYMVATKLLGERSGVVSGCALLVDYVLTITVSIAAAGDAIFSFLPSAYIVWKIPAEMLFILTLMTLNVRGVRDSILTLAPIFLLFVATHLILIVGGILAHGSEINQVARTVHSQYIGGVQALGAGGVCLLFIHAYSMGGGTYTGLEAVSNSMSIIREPRVLYGKRTMMYMAISLALTCGGLLVCYLLWNVVPQEGKTLNAVLVERVTSGFAWGRIFTILTLFSEGALLVVGAQTGFLGGQGILANMAVDSWVPRRFAALSERLTTANGVMLMGLASLAALLYTHGDIRRLVIMYSINVFLTFSLSMFGMLRLWAWQRKGRPHWKRRSALFSAGLCLCLTILVITITQKFTEGGWLTLVVTGGAILLCFMIKRHYLTVSAKLADLYAQLENIPRIAPVPAGEPDPTQPTAGLLVGGYSGVGIHSLLTIFRIFPGYFKNIVFLSVGVVDSGGFKGKDSIDALRQTTEDSLKQYVELARGLGIPATCRMAIGTDAVDEAENLCRTVADQYHRITFFGGKLIFRQEAWYQRLLHNETAFAIQRRLHWSGIPMVILPARIQ